MLKDQKMLDYSIRWAEHNDWTGATEANPAKWKYKPYGEGKDHVLFGDWQICFQTYIDLYNIEAAKGNAAASEYHGEACQGGDALMRLTLSQQTTGGGAMPSTW